jgi:hypothetical protein
MIAACLAMAAGLLVLAAGPHALAWRLGAGGEGRVAALTLGAQVHVAAGLGLVVLHALLPPGGWRVAALSLSWAGLPAFCLPLYLHAILGDPRAMPLTVAGLAALPGGWICAALALR